MVVDLHLDSKMAASTSRSPPSPLSTTDATTAPAATLTKLPSSPRVPDLSSILAYDHYLRLSDLHALSTSASFPDWPAEPLLKPSIQALEISFRLISLSLSDPRPYSSSRRWKLNLESLAAKQLEIISILCSDVEDNNSVPVADLIAANGVLAREHSSQEVWKLNGTAATIVSRTSEASLLPRLASWEKSEHLAAKILMQIETQMSGCSFTLGLGEPNLAGKPSLEYDLVVQPARLHSLKKGPLDDQLGKINYENRMLFTVHQILECWLCTAKQVVKRIEQRIDGGEYDKAGNDCWVLERIWKLLSEIEDLHLLMDPDDFLSLKSLLGIRASSGSEAFCFRSRALLEAMNMSKDLKHKVPGILGVEVDPNGGPRVQEAAMRLFHSRRRGEGDNAGRIQLLQGFQAVEKAVKEFFFGYRQLITAVMGSLEANGNRGMRLSVESSADLLTQAYMDPPYFPSLDAAKTFLGELWAQGDSDRNSNNGRCGLKQ